MSLKYMTTKEFEESVEALGFEIEHKTGYKENFIDACENGDTIAYVERGRQCMMTVKRTAEHNHNLLFKVLYAYASTPVSEREPKTYKLKVLDTNMYLIHINEHETTVTTNKKAAKAYDDAGVYDAKVLAEKQGLALRAEAISVDCE